MSRIFMVILCCGLITVNAASTEVSLKGTVKDEDGAKPIADASISLASKPSISTTSNDQGEFNLEGNITNVITPYSVSIKNSVITGIKGKSLQFSLACDCRNGQISVFSNNGRTVASIPLSSVKAGTQITPLPDLAAGVYLLVFTIDEVSVSKRLIAMGNEMYLNESYKNFFGNLGAGFGKTASAPAAVDTLVVKKSGYSTAKKPIDSYTKTGIEVVLKKEVEENCVLPNLPAPSGLTKENPKLPDPFTFFDGTKMTKKSQWPCRRKEILAMAQKYIYGPTPDVNPADITGTISGSTVSAQIKVNGTTKSASFNIGSGSGNILNISYGSGIAPSGCRTWNIQNGDMDSYNSTIKSIYGKEAGCRVMAAVWAVNVVCAVIKQNPNSGIKYIMTTGCSASAKSAFVTGAFCEGVDLTVIVESGGCGASNYRMAEWFKHGAGKSIYDCLDQGTQKYPQNLDNTDNGNFSGAPYFSTSVASWVASSSNIKNITKLPYDQHCLLACIAPRALCHFTNQHGKTDRTRNPPAGEWCHLGGTCEALSAWAAKPVWNALGVPENMGFMMYPNEGGNCPNHCSNPTSARNLANEFFKRVFQGDKNAKTDVMVFGEGDKDLQQPQGEWKSMWVDWDMNTKLE